MAAIYINGKLVDREKAVVSVYDHGFLYGDGVFEGLRFYNRKIFKLREHLDRLYDSARHIALTIPQSIESLSAHTLACVADSAMTDGYIHTGRGQSGA